MAFEERFTVTIDLMPDRDRSRAPINQREQRLNNTVAWVKKMGTSSSTFRDVSDDWAVKVQARARQRAKTKWKSRTGNAVEGIQVSVFRTNTGAQIVASNEATETERHVVAKSGKTYIYPGRGKKYGIFLELGMGGRYAVIVPTFHEMVPQLRSMLKSAIEEAVQP